MTAPYEALDRHFDGYVERGQLAGYSILIERSGALVHQHHHGVQRLGTDQEWDADTIVRIYSMTKPITSAAVMQLIEQGRLALDDRLDWFVPSFGQMSVRLAGGKTEPMSSPITIRQLLTHTSGLTYELNAPTGGDLAAVCEQWAELPLAFQPGTGWCYGVSTDVLGRVVELVSGRSLAEYFDQHLLGPLGMADTAFYVSDSKADRIAAIYTLDPDAGDGAGRVVPETADRNPPQGRAYLSGGGGLWGTARDYVRWCRAMLNGGELDGTRVLSEASVAAMTTNQLPEGRDIYSMCLPADAVDDLRGRGFGFGFAIELGGHADPTDPRPPAGTYDWGGAASTVFWCDPNHDEAVVFVTQLIPDALPIRSELVGLVNSAER